MAASPGGHGVRDALSGVDGMTGAVERETRAQTTPGVSYALARLHQRVLAGISERVGPHGLTTLQFTTLSILSRHGAPLST